jgi:hypothetical protein
MKKLARAAMTLPQDPLPMGFLPCILYRTEVMHLPCQIRTARYREISARHGAGKMALLGAIDR